MSLLRVIAGVDDAGEPVNYAATQEGHIETSLHSPNLPFGSVHAESITPVFQADGVYGVNSGQNLTTVSGSGAATSTQSAFSVSTGTTIYSQAVIQSRKRLRYRSGQGVVGRCSSKFTTPVADSYQLVGFGSATDGIYVGYRNTVFGILRTYRGEREVQRLTVTVGSSTAENITVTLNSVAFTVAVTNSANTLRTAYEISQGTYAGWKAEPQGSTVVFVADATGNKAGTFSLSGTTATGTFAELLAGVSETQDFVAQSSWNGDKLDGTGGSAVTIDPTKFNVWQFNIKYLGAGAMAVQCEICPTNSNNSTMVTVHTFKFPNSQTTLSIGNPSFPFTMAAYSAGSTTNLNVQCGSYAGFIEGQKILHGNRFTYLNSLTTVGATNLQVLFTIMNTRYYGGRANQSVVNIISVTAALKHTSPCIIYVVRNGVLAGNPNFTAQSSISCCYFDTAATTLTYSTNDQLIWTGMLGDTGEIDHLFAHVYEDFTIQPGEWVSVCAKAVTGTPSYVVASMNTREDQ